jgi:hypothetical protein
MSLADVERVVAEDPYAQFEVLEDWRHPNGDRLTAGRVLRADLYRDIQTYVKFGLRLGVPADHARLVTELREQKFAREAAEAVDVATRAERKARDARADAQQAAAMHHAAVSRRA